MKTKLLDKIRMKYKIPNARFFSSHNITPMPNFTLFRLRNEAYKTDQLINSVQDIKMKFARMRE